MGFFNKKKKQIAKKPAKYSGKLDGTSQQITLNGDLTIENPSDAIDLIADDAVIDGNGYTISASNVNHIFNITSKNVTFKNLRFKNCLMNDSSSIIKVDEATALTIESCLFESNILDGHVILNSGKTTIRNTGFTSNCAKASMICSKGNLILENCEFAENELKEIACAIRNLGTLYCMNSLFNANIAEKLILNEGECEIADCDFTSNSVNITVSNNGKLSIIKSRFSANEVNIANVFNNQICKMDNVKFESNKLKYRFEIFNMNKLILKDMTLGNEMIYDFNAGYNKFAGASDTLFGDNDFNEIYFKFHEEQSTEFAYDGIVKPEIPYSGVKGTVKPEVPYSGMMTEGIVKPEVPYSGMYKFTQWKDEFMIDSVLKDHHYLKVLIEKSDDITLNYDVSIEEPITIRKDNVVIDGKGHTLEGNGKDRIFHIKAKNVVLKNLTFINAMAPEKIFNRMKGYGGAIINEGELELVNCEFIDNHAKKDGYDILNMGDLKLESCRFSQNENGRYAIFNRGSVKAFDSERSELEPHISNGDVEWSHEIRHDPREGIFKHYVPLSGNDASSFSVYLSFDDVDSEFVSAEMKQYEHQKIDFTCNDSEMIPYSSLLIVFISRNSNRSAKISEEVKKALHHDVRVLAVYLDDVGCDFAEDHSGLRAFSIDRYRLSELEYMDRYREIFQLFGFKIENSTLPAPKPIETPPPADDVLTFTDLEKLLQGESEIELTADIYLADFETEMYEMGIDISRDGITVNGNGHSIIAKDTKKIFNVTAKNITFKNLNFKSCNMKGISAIIFVDDESFVTLDSCNFKFNDLDGGHALYTYGDVKIINSRFESNRSANEGPAIFARAGKVKIENTEFLDNSAKNSGGAILNWAKLDIADCTFEGNWADGYGGAIGNVIDASLSAKSTRFSNNHATGEGCAIYSENIVTCDSCSFTKHSSRLSLIFNENMLEMFSCNLEQNSARIIIQNKENGVLYLSNSKLMENEISIASVYNNGETASLEKVKFEGNIPVNPKSSSIYNETYMRLRDPNVQEKSILNKGHIDMWKCSPESVNNEGSFSVMDGPCDNEYSFSWLDRQIEKSADNIILLENNVRLENCELDFYEGGMEIIRDGLTIDGQGHYIDGAGRTSIFTVLAKGVTFKNITFQNASLAGGIECHITGGSAIRTVSGSSLKIVGCEFKDNECGDDGGAILNRSRLYVENSIFENNSSAGYGGAICNRATLHLDRNKFLHNRSRIRQDILNAGKISGNYLKDNVHDIKAEIGESHPFSILASEIAKSDKVFLHQDIMFDYRTDSEFKEGIPIIGRDSLTIDGRGFQISGADRTSFFNIKNSNVIFKNIIFADAYCLKSSAFENSGTMHFEDCIFLNNHSAFANALIENNGKITLSRCRFINNISKSESPIMNSHELQIINCEFSMNSNEKSLIANSGEMIIENTIFLNNHSNENAAAIQNRRDGQLSVEDSSFICNSTSASGGAIINRGVSRFMSCEFESNFAEGDGGAINNEKDASLEIINSRISANSSKGDGGAIINWGNLTFENTAFTRNTARKDGGAVNVQRGFLNIGNCLFDGNDSYDGGAIFNRGDLEIHQSEFEMNAARKDGGALNTYEGNIIISHASFKGNESADGGAIYSREGKIRISKSDFDSNCASINGGAIIKWCEMTIADSKFLNNSCQIHGGAINNQKEILHMSGCELSRNEADTGGAVFNVESRNLEINDCLIEDNFPDDIY